MPTINKTSPRRPWQAERKPFQRMKVDNQKFYNSAAWRKLSLKYKGANPLCVNHAQCYGVAEVCDHIKPIGDGGAKMDWCNLQSLCVRCNASKTGMQAHIDHMEGDVIRLEYRKSKDNGDKGKDII